MPMPISHARLIFLACCLIPLLAGLVHNRERPARALAPGDYGSLQEMVSPGFDYGAWFQDLTGYPLPDDMDNASVYFGAYALEAGGDTLFLGFGSGRPADISGSLLAASDGVTVTAIYTPTEQGFIDMSWQTGVLYIPGPDPTDVVAGEHQWDWGNTYVYTPTLAVVKHRNLENVIHTWGNWYDAANSTLYVAASSHLGDYQTWTGEVWRTTDSGSTWTRLADRDDGIGQYRTYDITGFGSKLYVTWNDDLAQTCGLAYSVNRGITWQRLAALDLQIACRPRLYTWNNELLALSEDRALLYTVDSNNQTSSHALPGFRVRDWSYNYLASDGSGRLYTVTDDGRIMRTSDLSSWETLAASDRALITLAYWPEKNWLVAADRGLAHARLFRLGPDTATAIVPPAPPALSVRIEGGQLRLDWDDGPAGYRVYRSTSPYFQSNIRLLAAMPAQSQYDDDSLGDVNSNYYYIARNAASDGNLSPDSNIVGEFDYALEPGD